MIDVVGQVKKHGTKKYARRDLGRVNKIILHHSATDGGSPYAFARYHVDENNWPGIGYHVVISSGIIYKTNYFTTISYQCSGQNTSSIGICMAADFDKVAPTDEQYVLYAKACIEVFSSLQRKVVIHYHNEYSKKTCPGKLFDKVKFESILKKMLDE